MCYGLRYAVCHTPTLHERFALYTSPSMPQVRSHTPKLQLEQAALLQSAGCIVHTSAAMRLKMMMVKALFWRSFGGALAYSIGGEMPGVCAPSLPGQCLAKRHAPVKPGSQICSCYIPCKLPTCTGLLGKRFVFLVGRLMPTPRF